jgi:hypothetical protein
MPNLQVIENLDKLIGVMKANGFQNIMPIAGLRFICVLITRTELYITAEIVSVGERGLPESIDLAKARRFLSMLEELVSQSL